MADIDIRIEGKIGRITLNRPQALNALTYGMILDIEAALDDWATDSRVALILIDATGDKAFCAGGDIQEMYDTASAGNFEYGRKFWADEYRMNAKLANFPKPFIALMQGFTMGGGVGVSCHGSHRVVCETSQIAMPECGIGLVPDVGGSMLLAQAPGRLGEYLGTTAARMDAGDAIHAGFADYYVPRGKWADLTTALIETGDWTQVDAFAEAAPASKLAAQQAAIDSTFGGETAGDILRGMGDDEWSQKAEKAMRRNCPLSVAATVELIHRVRSLDQIEPVLALEYRFTYRSASDGEFVEGIRAAIIDKDRNPQWNIPSIEEVSDLKVTQMLLPLGDAELNLKDKKMKIGFIGLGNMGGPMASNLVAAGHEVSGFDVAGVTIEGVETAATAAQAATGADVVITMLPNGQILRSVAAEIIPAMKSGACFVDCSTVDVESARAVADDASAAGLLAVDAPVSGGIGGAEAGTLTFMAGGSAAAFGVAEPLFAIMGQKAVHCGDSGAGQAAKICNNMILGATMIVTCEAFALADKLGLDRQKMFDVASTSSGYSWSMNAYCPAPGVGPVSPADNDYKPGFAAALMLKDLNLAQQAAEAADAATPLGQHARDMYEAFVEGGGGDMDFSAMLPHLAKSGH